VTGPRSTRAALIYSITAGLAVPAVGILLALGLTSVAGPLTPAAAPLYYLAYFGGWLVVNMGLVGRAYPPDRPRPYPTYVVMTLLFPPAATGLLVWNAVTKNRWAPTT